MLRAIQTRLGEIYDLDVALDVRDFLCDEETARELGGEDAAGRGEVLFVVEQAGDARVALFVDASAREPPSADGWLGATASFRACCLASEGVSHFVFVAFRAEHEDPVSELELELQAEIDKWALGLLAPFSGLDELLQGERAGLLAGHGVGLVALRDRSRRLRARLYERAQFIDAEGSERGERYRAATRLAARYARSLEHRFVEPGRLDALASELRRFYRLGAREKIERIG